MLHDIHRPHMSVLRKAPSVTMKLFAAFSLACAVVFFLLPSVASAHITSSKPTLQVTAGFNTRYRDNDWVPVQITLRNAGVDFSGTISINVSSGQLQFGGYTNPTYQAPITLANGAQKEVTLYVPLYFGTQGVTVNLLGNNGAVVTAQTAPVSGLSTGDTFVGILSDQNQGFGALTAVQLPGQTGSVITEFLDATTLPSMADVLKNFNLIVLDNFTTSTLSQAQLTALQTWINQGGALIVAGGPEWQRTLSSLPGGLLPVTVTGTATLPAGTTLLPVGGPGTASAGQNGSAATTASALTISTATIPSDIAGQSGGSASGLYNEVILSSGSLPLIVQTHRGQGNVTYLAYDPSLQPIVGGTQADALWKGLLLRSLGDKLITAAYVNRIFPGGPQGSMQGVLQNLLPNSLPSPWLLIMLLAGYIVVLGPIRYLVVRWRKQRSWNWRIVLSSIVVFSLLTYGLALQEKGTSILTNRISVIQLNQGGSSAHVTSYLGVFVPNQGNFQVHIPGMGLVQPPSNQVYQVGYGGPASSINQQGMTVTPGPHSTDVNLLGVDIWTLRSLVSEQDQQVRGGVESRLTINNNMLTGTVTNTLSYALSDVYVLLPNTYGRIGDLAAGQTKAVSLSVGNAPSSPNSGANLATQIAIKNGLPVYYGSSGQPPQSEAQRHAEIMAALSGSYYGGYYGGGYCAAFACPLGIQVASITGSSGVIVVGKGVTGSFTFAPLSGGGPGYYIQPGADPLLVGGIQPTLIGWANKSTVNAGLTINGINPAGLDETMVQAPLSVNYSGTLTLPTNLEGQIVDVEGNNVQSPSPGVYTLATGSITFEFTLPSSTNVHLNNLTFSEPQNLVNFAGLPNVTDISQQARLYNWHTHSWDSISLNQQQGFSTRNSSSYVGPNGRVLLQFGNQDSSKGTGVFGTPSLNLQGNIDGGNA